MPHVNHHANRRLGRPAPAIAIGVLIVVASITWSSAAGAAPATGCGEAWTLATESGFVAAALAANDVDRGSEFELRLHDAFELADRNGDDQVCYRFNKGNQGQDKAYVDPVWELDGHYVITNVNDNNSRPQ